MDVLNKDVKFDSEIKAPNDKGIKSKNENFALSSLSIPKNNADEIVIPLLEIPGKRANIWDKPIIKDFLLFSCESIIIV